MDSIATSLIHGGLMTAPDHGALASSNPPKAAARLEKSPQFHADPLSGDAPRIQTLALDDALALWYSELRELARRALRSERKNHTLQATELVNELVVKLIEQGRVEFNDRRHVFNYFAAAFRNVLCDHAKARSTLKRGGNLTRVSLSYALDVTSGNHAEEWLALERAMDKLRALDSRAAQVVESRFCGLKELEIADLLGCSERFVRKELTFARAWLLCELRGQEA